MPAKIDMMMEGRLDSQGREIPDDTPVAMPAGFKHPEDLQTIIRRLIRSEEWQRMAEKNEMDTFEEAEDFDIDDDMFDPHSPYEEVFDPVLQRGISHDEFVKNAAVYEQRYIEATQKAYHQMEVSDALRARRRPPPPAEQSGSAPAAPIAQDSGKFKESA